MGTDVPAPTDKPAKAGTVTAALAFLAGGVGTIVAAIGDFGSDSSALAVARRNHSTMLLAAASCAAFGLMLGALYPFLRGWSWHKMGKGLLALGVVAVAAGVGVGASATILRAPGRPTITLQRLDADSVQIEITADGLASSDWYEAIVSAYKTAKDGTTTNTTLAGARFSPGQDGTVDWKARIAFPAKSTKRTRLLVRVQKDSLVKDRDCNTDADVTCLNIYVPPSAPSPQSATTPASTSTTTSAPGT